MAIQFKAAPGSKGDGGDDFLAVLFDPGSVNTFILIIGVVVLYALVTYLRRTPGYKVTDFFGRRRKPADGDAGVAVQRTGRPAAEAEAEQENA